MNAKNKTADDEKRDIPKLMRFPGTASP